MDLFEYWTEFPTLRSLVMGAVGFKPQHSHYTHGQKASKGLDPDMAKVLVREWGAGGQILTADHLPAFVQQGMFDAGLLKFDKPPKVPPQQEAS